MNSRRQEEYDRDYTEMVSGLKMEGFDSAPPTPPPADPPEMRQTPDRPPEPFHQTAAKAEVEPDDPDPSEYTPPPLPPMKAPKGVAAFGWACAAYVLAALMLTIVGVQLPTWAGWLAVVAFVAAIIIGWRSLPKHRDADDDGAVV